MTREKGSVEFAKYELCLYFLSQVAYRSMTSWTLALIVPNCSLRPVNILAVLAWTKATWAVNITSCISSNIATQESVPQCWSILVPLSMLGMNFWWSLFKVISTSHSDSILNYVLCLLFGLEDQAIILVLCWFITWPFVNMMIELLSELLHVLGVNVFQRSYAWNHIYLTCTLFS